MARTKLCRALDCPRRIERFDIFCTVHWPQLTPRYQAPIPENREPGANVRPESVSSILKGVAAAVAFIAYKEGKRGRLRQAQNAQAFAPGQGGTPAATTPITTDTEDGTGLLGSGSGGGGSYYGSYRYSNF